MSAPHHDLLLSRRDRLKPADLSAAGFLPGNQVADLAVAAEVNAAPAAARSSRMHSQSFSCAMLHQLLPLASAFTLALAFPLHAQTVSIAPSDKGLRIDIDGALFTEYVTKGITNPCFNPIMGANGANLAREYPPAPGVKVDHPHHRGIWIGHDGVNGVNFWAADSGKCRIENTGFTDVNAEGHRASFVAASKWLNPAGELVLEDRRHVVITALPDGARQLDLAITFLATAGDVTFRDTKEGSVAIRVAPSIAVKGNRYDPGSGRGHIRTSAGMIDANAWGTRANWVTYFGPDPKGDPVSITMMDHPHNLRHPTWWHVRTYGLFAANPFGEASFAPPAKGADGKVVKTSVPKGKASHVLPSGQSLTLRYRFLFQKGEPDSAKLNTVFKEYSATK